MPPKQKHEFVQLEPGEDVASVRDRLTFLRGQHVLLIWPEKGSALNRKLDLVLVQREAMRMAIRLALITHDAEVIRQANELNISTFETIGASERGKWKRGRSRVFTDRFGRPEADPEPEELMPVASRVRVESKRSPLRFVARIFVLLLLFALTGAVAVLLVPSATITITPAQERLEAEAVIQAQVDPEGSARLDVENGIMPAVIARAQIEERGSVPTSGSQNLSDTSASGAVVFINKTNSAISLPGGALVSTSAGTPILFRTTQAVNIPAGVGLQSEVPIQAVEASVGSIGNVDAGLINTVLDPVLAEQIEVRNIAPTTGGDSRSIGIVTQDDRDRLIDILRQQVQDRAYTEMLPRLESTQFIIPETIHIAEERSDWMTFDHEVGETAESLSLTMRAVVEATVVDESVAQQIAFTRLSAQIPRGHAVRTETLLYERGAVTEIQPGGSVTFTMVGSGLMVTQVNFGQLQASLAGRTPEEAVQYLVSEVNLTEGTTPQVVLNPEWLPRLPLLPLRITIHTEIPSL
ncbi:MAG: hypothetical protein ABI835_13065 [Chloroflexota bacterium]